MRERGMFGRLAWLAVAAGLLLTGCGGGSRARNRSERPTVSFQRVAGRPFGVVITPDGKYAFVDLVDGRVLVYSLTGRVPRLVRTIAVPGDAVGSSLTRDGRLLLVASGDGAAVISVIRAEGGAPHPVLGTLKPPLQVGRAAFGAIETASSADGRYVFVSLEYGRPGGVVSVYDIGSDRAPRFASTDYVGSIRLGESVVGSALSPNGRYLYVTSEAGGGAAPSFNGPEGTLSVINVGAAERKAAHPVVATVAAMLQPVRVAVSPDGSTVWVTARASNRVLAFSAQRLLTDSGKALIAQVRVGTEPVGVAVFDHGTRLIVAVSDRFNQHGAHASLTIINAQAALAGHHAVTATIRAGLFPREIAIDPSQQRALVTNFESEQLETVNLSPPPR